MKTIRLLTLVALTSLPVIAQEAAPMPSVFSVGVLPFAETDDTKSLGSSASELVGAQLGMSGNLVLIERSQLDAVLSEQGMGLTGAVDPQSAAKLGNLTGAQILVTGRVFKAGKNTYCIAKAISTATGRSLPAQTQVKGDDWMNAATTLATALDAAIVKNASDMAPKAETPEARIDRLKKMVEGKTLPKVFIRIPEEHLSRIIPDPAVQTEIEFTLQKIGVTVVTNETEADVVVAGEAFSERAIQLGTLVSCRARCELTLTKKSAPGTKQVNRITTGTVDIAENTAAKQALQNAGAKLADWVVAELVK
ncbi:MAG: CsgG/HfaB family protein [Luteolibacter sp.]